MRGQEEGEVPKKMKQAPHKAFPEGLISELQRPPLEWVGESAAQMSMGGGQWEVWGFIVNVFTLGAPKKRGQWDKCKQIRERDGTA